MRNAGKNRKRKLSAGTKFMLALTAAVLCFSALILERLSSGASIDLSKLRMNVLDIEQDQMRNTDKADQPKVPKQAAENNATAAPQVNTTIAPQGRDGIYTLTIGGSISLSGEVRKNSWNTDARVTDYADMMILLAPRIRSDVNCVFLENILSDIHKTNDYVAPASAVGILREAGFNMAACGFAQAYSGGRDGVEATLSNLSGKGIRTVGILSANDDDIPAWTDAGGIRTAFLQYTTNVPAKTRKNMERDGTSGMVPEAGLERIQDDIARAREQGAEAVIVLLSWGKNGKETDRPQRELAEGIAQAGADLIVGNGSHIPETAEYLNGKDGRPVLCVWSLGTLVSGDRSNVRKLSGYLLHVTVKTNAQGNAEILNPTYTPVYTWKYKQDGRFYYRCIASDSDVPDGMDNDQKKMMSKCADAVYDILKDSPLVVR